MGFNFWQTELEASFRDLWTGQREAQSEREDGTDLMFSAGVGVNFLKGFELLALYNKAFYDDDADYLTATIGYNFDLSR